VSTSENLRLLGRLNASVITGAQLSAEDRAAISEGLGRYLGREVADLAAALGAPSKASTLEADMRDVIRRLEMIIETGDPEIALGGLPVLIRRMRSLLQSAARRTLRPSCKAAKCGPMADVELFIKTSGSQETAERWARIARSGFQMQPKD